MLSSPFNEVAGLNVEKLNGYFCLTSKIDKRVREIYFE